MWESLYNHTIIWGTIIYYNNLALHKTCSNYWSWNNRRLTVENSTGDKQFHSLVNLEYCTALVSAGLNLFPKAQHLLEW